MSGLPLVVVVTPCLDAERFVDQTLQSVREQSYPWVEHVVVDGGSTDGTLEIVRRSEGVRLISEPDSGQAEAIAKGFNLGRGQILAWLNADDFYLPGAIEQAVRLLTDGGFSLVYSGDVWVDEKGLIVRENVVQAFDYDRMLNSRNQISQPTTFFTRSAYEAVGGLNTELEYTMDYDLWLRIAKRHLVGWSDAKWAAFRLHPASKTVALAEHFWPEERRVSRSHGGHYFSRGYLDRMAVRHPRRAYLIQRAAAGWRMLRRGDFGRFVRRAAGIGIE